MTAAYFHGGVRGLAVGDLILPPDETNAYSMTDSALSGHTPAELRDEVLAVHRKDRVYLTTCRTSAFYFARYYPGGSTRLGGDVYRAEPVGDIEPDPDYLLGDDGSVAVPRARVVAVLGRSVRRQL